MQDIRQQSMHYIRLAHHRSAVRSIVSGYILSAIPSHIVPNQPVRFVKGARHRRAPHKIYESHDVSMEQQHMVAHVS